MKRILVAVTGPDSFGVVYTTSDTLNKLGCLDDDDALDIIKIGRAHV